MTTKQEEIRARVCVDHKTFLEDILGPPWKWNPVFLLPAEKCQIDGCHKAAYWVAIGLKFPDAVGQIERDHGTCKANYEVYMEAKQVLGQGEALEALTQYMYTRMPKTVKRRLFNKFAQLILRDIGIDATIRLNDRHKHAILKYLEMYPEETG